MTYLVGQNKRDVESVKDAKLTGTKGTREQESQFHNIT